MKIIDAQKLVLTIIPPSRSLLPHELKLNILILKFLFSKVIKIRWYEIQRNIRRATVFREDKFLCIITGIMQSII